jgi:hypothetical protein
MKIMHAHNNLTVLVMVVRLQGGKKLHRGVDPPMLMIWTCGGTFVVNNEAPVVSDGSVEI